MIRGTQFKKFSWTIQTGFSNKTNLGFMGKAWVPRRFFSEHQTPDPFDNWKKKLRRYTPYYNKATNFMMQNLLSLLLVLLTVLFLLKQRRKKISFDKVLRLIKDENFDKLVVYEKRIFGISIAVECKIITETETYYCEVFDEDLLLKYALETQQNSKGNVIIREGMTIEEKIRTISSILLVFGYIGIFLIPHLIGKKGAQGGIPGVDMKFKFKAKRFNKDTHVKTRFQNVAGLGNTRQEIEEFVDFLKHSDKYKAVGAKLPKGALLSGPPGTGKTLLAKAVAGEAGVPFFFTSGSEFVEMYVGLGASRVRELFKSAKESESAIIFIDEIDAIGKKRAGKLSSNAETDATLNQLLVEMDGFGTSHNIVVFAATNRKDLLDPALTRPGRFDRTIDINLPDISARVEIFDIHLKPLKLANPTRQVKIATRLAALTPGFSGADIANICNEAAIHAVRNNRSSVEDIDFEMAIERIIGGLPTNKTISDEERKIVAIHESGHGVVSWFLKGAAPLLKLTIIPRSKGALGFAQYLPNEIPLESPEDLKNKIIAILGGRTAEMEFFGRATTGAYDDLQKAFRIAHAIVTKLGMSKNIGQVVYDQNEYGVKNYSASKNREIDIEIKSIIEESTKKCAQLVKIHRDKIQKLSEVLLEKETIDLKIIKTVLGERPFEPESTFKAYLQENEIELKTDN